MSKIPEHSLLRLYGDGRYLTAKTTFHRSAFIQKQLQKLIDRGYITVEDDKLANGAITVTDAGRKYLKTHR